MADAKSAPRKVEADYWPCQQKAVIERWLDAPGPGLWTVTVRPPWRGEGAPAREMVFADARAAAAQYRIELGRLLIESGERLRDHVEEK